MSETILYSFSGSQDGANPVVGVLPVKGALFGATLEQGNGQPSTPYGVVYELIRTVHRWREINVHVFGGGPDGASPEGGLTTDSSGALYGTTTGGGLVGCGVVYKLTPTKSGYAERVLYSFRGVADGCEPYGDVVVDHNGVLYGTTSYGGNVGSVGCTFSCGIVYSLTPSPSGYTERILYSFLGNGDGANPSTGLLAGKAGTLFGVTNSTVFELRPRRNVYRLRVLHTFGGAGDGGYPSGPLAADSTGALYGATYGGGALGYGSIYRLAGSGTAYSEQVIYSFSNGTDGARPRGDLAVDPRGVVYGAAFSGGGIGSSCFSGQSACGTVFELRPTPSGYTFGLLHHFLSDPDGAYPEGGVALGPDGALYGTTFGGGLPYCSDSQCGTVFRVTVND